MEPQDSYGGTRGSSHGVGNSAKAALPSSESVQSEIAESVQPEIAAAANSAVGESTIAAYHNGEAQSVSQAAERSYHHPHVATVQGPDTSGRLPFVSIEHVTSACREVNRPASIPPDILALAAPYLHQSYLHEPYTHVGCNDAVQASPHALSPGNDESEVGRGLHKPPQKERCRGASPIPNTVGALEG